MRVIDTVYFQEFINQYKQSQEEQASKGLGLQYFGPRELQLLLDKMPTVEAEPVRHGRWEFYPDSNYLRCSICRLEFPREKLPTARMYCPACGTKMDLKE